MSNSTASTNEPGHASDAPPHHHTQPQTKSHGAIAHFSSTLLERGDSLIYAIVGVSFFLGAAFALGYSFWDFVTSLSNIHPATPQADVANAIIRLVSDLLLVLIIMEVLSTVIHYLKSHATSLHPFLYIGIISATRGILSIGARLSVGTVHGPDFNESMIELGVNAAAVLALGLTLKLLGRTAEIR